MTRRKRRRAWLRRRCAERVDAGEDTNTMKRAIIPVPGGAALCQRMFTRIGCAGPPPAFRVEFYPYASLVLTIRRRDEQMIVRFSDLLQRAPLAVLEGAAALLLSRIYRRRPRKTLGARYPA